MTDTLVNPTDSELIDFIESKKIDMAFYTHEGGFADEHWEAMLQDGYMIASEPTFREAVIAAMRNEANE